LIDQNLVGIPNAKIGAGVGVGTIIEAIGESRLHIGHRTGDIRYGGLCAQSSTGQFASAAPELKVAKTGIRIGTKTRLVHNIRRDHALDAAPGYKPRYSQSSP
jgi:hypothetical protein